MRGYGLVLGGGGAKGSYEIGVWKALRELEIPLIGVAGTSVGALNGAMVVQGDYDKAFDLWTTISVETVISMNKAISELDRGKKAEEIKKLIVAAVNSGGLDVTPLKKLLASTIDEDKIRESGMDFGVVTFSLTDLKPVSIFIEEIPEGRLVDYLLASASFPAFKPMEIDGKKYIDGALYDNIPVSLMLQKKIYNVISVDISGIGIVRKIKDKNLKLIEIKNSENLGPVLEFSIESAKRNIEIGYYDAMKAFGRYKGKYYYLTDTSSNMELDENDIKLVYQCLGIDWTKRFSPQNRFIIYKLIRNLKNYCRDKKFRNTDGVISAAAEITAEALEIERLKPYSLQSLIDAIIDKYNCEKKDISYENFSKLLDDESWIADKGSLNEKLKKAAFQSKHAALYKADINDISDKAILYRRLLAIAFPKICIANICIALLMNK
ncbi:patatin-like phospholipase family protein [Lutispora sp.]|uniref:patatin-like phospholipase family protein n=1 Tax=Lutispora sp. TaxID=2828727 RepID=UPI002B1F28FE|nr:patatin-like phospholipase family protein [Lutispora sp.]MEA4961410.1 patatin-like phospholipase family protein [Lutispora sp.]